MEVEADLGNWNTLLTERDGDVLHVWLNRPDARNAWTAEMHHEFDRVLDEAEDDAGVKVVTLRGKGKIFSAGHDLKEVAGGYSSTGRPGGWDPHEVPHIRRPWYFSKPLIAGVHGYVGPIAFAMLTCCDFILAVEGTRFSFEQARMGGGAPGASPQVFHFRPGVWKKLLMMGGWMDAAQARDLHFVARLLADEPALDAELQRWAAQLALVPTKQLRAAKVGIHRQYELMGLAQMGLVQNRESGHGSPEDMKWFSTVMEKGLKEALKERDAQFDQEVSRV
jgi:enoyl-CoA hydratase/carnithine racemase